MGAALTTWAIGLAPPLTALGVLVLPRARTGLITGARWLVLAAAAVVVAVVLLPEAWSGGGVAALALVAVGFVVPSLLERVSHVLGEATAPALGFGAVFLHQIVDGVQVGALVGPLGASVGLAVAAHGAPLVAATILAVEDSAGRRRAWMAGLVLVGGMAIGIGAGLSLPVAGIAESAHWLSALVSGVILHLLVHDLRPRPAGEPGG